MESNNDYTLTSATFSINETTTDISFCSDIVYTDSSLNTIDISMCMTPTKTEFFDISLCNIPLNVELYFKYSSSNKLKRIILLLKDSNGKIVHNLVSSSNIDMKNINEQTDKSKCFYHSDSSSSDSDYYRHLRHICRYYSSSSDSE